MSDTSPLNPQGISRRDLIRRGAIVGGVAWTAPIVSSLGSAAFASGSDAEEGDCDDYVFVKISLVPASYAGAATPEVFENSDSSDDSKCKNALIAAVMALGGAVTFPAVALTNWDDLTKTAIGHIAGHGAITAVFADTNVGGSFDEVTVTAPDDCRILASSSQLGRNCQAATRYAPLPRSFTFKGGGYAALSHVDLILCCNDDDDDED